MPLFDAFKKSNKRDDLLLSPEQQKKRHEAAMDFLKFFQEKTPLLNGRPHAGTVLSVPARLAGTSLFRAVNKKDFPPHVVVLSEEVNQAYPQLLNLFAYYCQKYGIDIMAKPLVHDIPDRDKPLMDLARVQAEYQDQYNEIMKRHGLDYLAGARAGMIACSIVFNYHCIANKDIDPYIATGIVAMGVVEGAKTSPAPQQASRAGAPSENGSKQEETAGLVRTIAESSIHGSGNRLVFGERNAAVQEALDHGGKFVDVPSEVESILTQSNIDPYVIYVTALILEMQSKTAQIDFAGRNVDQLTLEWSNKPEERAPVHIRQVLWLEENAEKFGYQRRGNSWKLKQ